MVEQASDAYQGPFWRSNEASFIVLKAVTEAELVLNKVLREGRIVNGKLIIYYSKYPSNSDEAKSDEAMEEFSDICQRLWELESELSCCTRTAILMAIIDLESTVNMFCYFNLGETATNAIENLSLTAKIEVAHRVLGLPEFKGTHHHHAVRMLLNWRNAFAHGKTTDMPYSSLRENHLREPKKYPDPGDMVQEMLTLLRGYLAINQHLREISKHPYTSGYAVEQKELEERLERIETFQFDEGQLVGRRRLKR